MFWLLNPAWGLFGKLLAGTNRKYLILMTEVQYQGTFIGLVNFLVAQEWTTVKKCWKIMMKNKLVISGLRLLIKHLHLDWKRVWVHKLKRVENDRMEQILLNMKREGSISLSQWWNEHDLENVPMSCSQVGYNMFIGWKHWVFW